MNEIEEILQKIIELRNKKQYSQRKLAMVSGVSNSTISRIENASSDTDPETLKKLAPYLDIPYMKLMEVAGYVKEFSNFTEETFGDEDFKKVFPVLLKSIQEMILKSADEEDKKFIEKNDIKSYFDILNDNKDKAAILNEAIEKIKYLPSPNGYDELEIYSLIPINKDLIPYMKKQYNKFVSLYNQNIKQTDQQILPESFSTPEEAIKFLLEQNVIMGFGGFNIDKLSDEEKIAFANELLGQLKLLSYKYKK